MTNSEATVKDGLQDTKSTVDSSGQPLDSKQTEVNYEKQYKELQGEFDKRNESSYKKDLKLAELDKKYILCYSAGLDHQQ